MIQDKSILVERIHRKLLKDLQKDYPKEPLFDYRFFCSKNKLSFLKERTIQLPQTICSRTDLAFEEYPYLEKLLYLIRFHAKPVFVV